MIILIIIYIYALVKGKQMMGREEWSLVQQEVVSSLGELSKAYNFNETEYSNISIALQFYTKKEKQTAALKQKAQVQSSKVQGGRGGDRIPGEGSGGHPGAGGGALGGSGAPGNGGGPPGGGGRGPGRMLQSKKEQKLKEY